jgi:flavin reductase (DIM6/NTAB) family NADH-FMN oxidoreductase RutF
MAQFKEINIRSLQESATGLLAGDWGLVTAGTRGRYNTMTVSWGALGEIWGKDAAFIFIRPERYTFRFLQENDRFTLCFFPPDCHKALAYCGSHSGRDGDKAAATGLSPVFDGDLTYFDQARIVLCCRKMAQYDLGQDGFLDPQIMDNYQGAGFHRMFIAEVERTLLQN